MIAGIYRISIIMFTSGTTANDSVRTNKDFFFCKRRVSPSNPDPQAVLLTLNWCNERGSSLIVTKGLEWTPQGFITYYKVDKDLNAGGRPVPLRKSQIGISTGKKKGWEHGPVCPEDMGQWLVPVDPDTTDEDPVVFEQVAVSHLPVAIGHSTWAPIATNRTVGKYKFKIHYIRVFQPAITCTPTWSPSTPHSRLKRRS